MGRIVTRSLAALAGFALAAVLLAVVISEAQAALTAVTTIPADWRTPFLNAIADPDVAFILLLVGIYGLLIEVGHPGVYFPGVAGAVCLLLALIAMSVLPVQFGALGLLLLGIALMIAEAFTPGIGALGIGGLAAFVAGAAFLFEPGQTTTAVSIPLIAGSALVCAGLTFVVMGAAVKARRRPTITGAEQLIGSRARVVEWQHDRGIVHTHGERWAARSEASLTSGDSVRVTSRDGLILTVQPE